MILQHAILDIKPGKAKAFEEALKSVQPLIAASPGFERMDLRACIESKDRYLLLIWWTSVEAHTHGFRQSERFSEWRAAINPFLEKFPAIQHYTQPL